MGDLDGGASYPLLKRGTFFTEIHMDTMTGFKCFVLFVSALFAGLVALFVSYLKSQWKRWWKVILAADMALVFSLLGVISPKTAWTDWFINLGTEVFGAVVIFVLLERLVTGKEREEELKRQFAGMMGSANNEVALRGAAELHARGLLADGILKEYPDLRGADLSYTVFKAYRDTDDEPKLAIFEGVDLSRARLMYAEFLDKIDLSGVVFRGANLSGARLRGVNLHKADLEGANLTGANLKEANLSYVALNEASTLSQANLQGADLFEADLLGLNVASVLFNKHTKLPDGTFYSSKRDLACFVRPTYPGGPWKSSDPESPAYPDNRRKRGK
jgi:uncharacterized protein YjbI with pentapeptide repeats